VPPGPATLELGDEPPALVNLLTGGWRMTEDALSATLLDLAARDMIDLVQSGPQPEQTICRIREPAPPHLTAYERRVYDRVAGLASGGVVPVAALARGSQAEASRWWKGFRREVIVDAQRRGLSRNRWGPGVKTLFSLVSVAPAGAVALTVGYASTDGDAPWPAAFFTWLVLAGYAASRNRQRDTPAGREAAARWLGVRDHLGRNEVFDTLPPAAVAIWDRYLGYGAAAGVAGTASRVLSFGAQSERLAWSAYGGSWHRVRIRYPGNRAAEGRHPAAAGLVGLVVAVAGWYGIRLVQAVRRRLDAPEGLGLGPDVDELLDRGWARLVLAVALALALAAVAWGAYTVFRAVLDLGGRRTFEAEVLRVRTVRNDDKVTDYQVALDDGKGERTRAWSVSPKRMPALLERDVVEVVAQVNGKLRDRVVVPAGISEIELEQIVLARDKVRTALGDREPDRVIHAGGRLVNIVVR
jgi:MYXO-CTERM domain-containing protein